MTLVPHEPTPARDVVDGWVHQVADVARFADYIAQTDFVPGSLRGNAAAVAAAILAGREVGIGPMTALQHLHVIDGRPAMSAQLMRALVLAAGHTLRVAESSSARCVLVGARRGGVEQAVTWTMDDAKRAGVAGKQTWSRYPRQMLLARATGELCRAIFPDVIGGMAYTHEEAAEIDAPPDVPPVVEAAPTKPVRRARKAAAPKAPPETPAAVEDVQAPPPPPPQAPLRRQRRSPRAATPEEWGPLSDPIPEDNGPAPSPQATPAPSGEGVTPELRQALHARLREWGRLEPRSLKLRTLSGLAGRELISAAQLTDDETRGILDTLAYLTQAADPDTELSSLVTLGWANINRQATHDQPPLFDDGDPPE